MKYSDYDITVQKYCTIHEKPLSYTKNNGSFKVATERLFEEP